MKRNLVIRVLSCCMLGGLPALLVLPGCKDEHDHKHGKDGHTHDKTPSGSPATAPTTGEGHSDVGTGQPLGTKTAGGYELKAMQDEPVKPGGEAAFDLQVAGGPGKPKAVRFWVGVESGEGSAKAKAEEENPGTWHTHVEVPDPLPQNAQFWAEIEPPTGQTVKAAFDIKR